jgi:hypothetical protein
MDHAIDRVWYELPGEVEIDHGEVLVLILIEFEELRVSGESGVKVREESEQVMTRDCGTIAS